MADVTQVQVNADIGLGFDTMIRSLLRQDPDVMLIGEIRDGATANAAVESASRAILFSPHYTPMMPLASSVDLKNLM